MLACSMKRFWMAASIVALSTTGRAAVVDDSLVQMAAQLTEWGFKATVREALVEFEKDPASPISHQDALRIGETALNAKVDVSFDDTIPLPAPDIASAPESVEINYQQWNRARDPRLRKAFAIYRLSTLSTLAQDSVSLRALADAALARIPGAQPISAMIERYRYVPTVFSLPVNRALQHVSAEIEAVAKNKTEMNYTTEFDGYWVQFVDGDKTFELRAMRPPPVRQGIFYLASLARIVTSSPGEALDKFKLSISGISYSARGLEVLAATDKAEGIRVFSGATETTQANNPRFSQAIATRSFPRPVQQRSQVVASAKWQQSDGSEVRRVTTDTNYLAYDPVIEGRFALAPFATAERKFTKIHLVALGARLDLYRCQAAAQTNCAIELERYQVIERKRDALWNFSLIKQQQISPLPENLFKGGRASANAATNSLGEMRSEMMSNGTFSIPGRQMQYYKNSTGRMLGRTNEDSTWCASLAGVRGTIGERCSDGTTYIFNSGRLTVFQ